MLIGQEIEWGPEGNALIKKYGSYAKAIKTKEWRQFIAKVNKSPTEYSGGGPLAGLATGGFNLSRMLGGDPTGQKGIAGLSTALPIETVAALGLGGLGLAGGGLGALGSALSSGAGAVGSALGSAGGAVGAGAGALAGGAGDLLGKAYNYVSGTGKGTADLLNPSNIGNLIDIGGTLTEANTKAQMAKGQQDVLDDAYDQLMAETGTEAPMLGSLREDISRKSTEAQKQQQKLTNMELAQQGVRGGQASTLTNRASGTLQQSMQSDLNKLAYEDYMNRYKTRTGALAAKAGLSGAK